MHFPEAALHSARSKGIFKTTSRSEPAKCFDLRETPWIKKQSRAVWGRKGQEKKEGVRRDQEKTKFPRTCPSYTLLQARPHFPRFLGPSPNSIVIWGPRFQYFIYTGL